MHKILLIHPDPRVSDELTFILQHSGFQVVNTSGGEQALAEIRRRQPDLIVMAEGSQRLTGDWGISLQSVAFWNDTSPEVNNNKVVNNMVTAEDGLTGIEIFTYNAAVSATLVAENNKLMRNSISGYATAIDDGGTESKVHANASP